MPKGIYVRGPWAKHVNNLGPPEIQFWKRVDRNGPVHPVCGQCWTWIADQNDQGYGVYKKGGAHRWAYRIEVGCIPDGLFVLHRCDNPSCVNPAHLFLGTAQDNMDDKIAKGRQGDSGTKTPLLGESNVKAILTESQVVRARHMYADGLSGKQIKKILNVDVSLSSLYSAIKSKTWRHLLPSLQTIHESRKAQDA